MWVAVAPSNIALIKYMGKQSANMPCNISLSYTLNNLYTTVTLRLLDASSKKDTYINTDGFSEAAVNKYLDHLNFIKNSMGCTECFEVTAVNNFPHSSGVASSASSFAALTMCAFKAISDIFNISAPSVEKMANISKRGSGSSCRSFFAPWCVWNENSVNQANIKINLLHDLIIIDANPKKTSSSMAHELVKSSLLFTDRPRRAEVRYEQLVLALNSDHWKMAFNICWAEFMDMHALFETSIPNFGYITSKTFAALENIQTFWKHNNDGPIVTIDAGPNIHLLWKESQENLRALFYKQFYK